MNEYSIVTVPNPKLFKVTQKVTLFDIALENQTKLMRKFLRQNDGIGLAANQLGFENQICIVEYKDSKDSQNAIPFQIFINPKIIQKSTEIEMMDEGCLSVPQIELPVERATKIKVRAQNLQGKIIKITATDLLARILQHEIDHLNGLVYTEYVKAKFLHDFPEFKKARIIFFGSGDFAATICLGLILLGLNLEIITEKAKPAGRKQKLKPSPVATLAQKFDKKYYELDNFSNFPPDLSGFDLLLCSDFGKIIPENILKMAKKAINIHPSLLPKYRGATPIQNAILNGDKTTGVSLIKMVAEIDQGPVIAQAKMKIEAEDNALSLEKRLSTLAMKLIYGVLPKIINDKLLENPQDEAKVTLTRKFKKIDGEIDWQMTPAEIERKIRAFYPWPGSYTFLDEKRLIIHQAHLKKDKIVFDIVQKEGKRPIRWKEFLRGYHGPKPEWMEKLKN